MTTPTEENLGEALHDLVSAQPFQPDPTSIQRRSRRLRRRTLAARSSAVVALTAVAALVAVTATNAASHHSPTHIVTTSPAGSSGTGSAHSTAHSTALTELAAYITANATHQTGDATLVIRTQSYPGRASIGGADLYTDSGEYFYAQTESGLPAAIAGNDNQGDGMFAREIAAAIYAVNGNLTIADQKMAYAPFASGKPPVMTAAQRAATAQAVAEKMAAAGIQAPRLQPLATAYSFNSDNYIWEDSEDALVAGSGNPQVRAGILHILSTLPGITVTEAQVDGQPALTITASGTPDLPANYHETITINATTGIPIRFEGGTNGQAPSVTVTYQVSRVTVSAIEAGHFG
jgi:hypothetical protein